MQAPEARCNMFVLVSSGGQSGHSVLNQLQATDLVVRKNVEQGVARVQARGNKCTHQHCLEVQFQSFKLIQRLSLFELRSIK